MIKNSIRMKIMRDGVEIIITDNKKGARMIETYPVKTGRALNASVENIYFSCTNIKRTRNARRQVVFMGSHQSCVIKIRVGRQE